MTGIICGPKYTDTPSPPAYGGGSQYVAKMVPPARRNRCSVAVFRQRALGPPAR
jgi:hypothetical protein